MSVGERLKAEILTFFARDGNAQPRGRRRATPPAQEAIGTAVASETVCLYDDRRQVWVTVEAPIACPPGDHTHGMALMSAVEQESGGDAALRREMMAFFGRAIP